MSEHECSVGQIEQYLLLRLPPHIAQQVHKSISNDTLEERLQVQMAHDGRHCNLRFDDSSLFGKVVDLPSIVEVNKTLDKKTVYKSGNIGQMVICSEDPIDPPIENLNDLTLKQRNQLQKRYQWKHGITPPLKNVRKRRFRKTALKKLIDSPEIEREVRRLLQEDTEAVNVEFELLTDEETKPAPVEIPPIPEPLDTSREPSQSQDDKEQTGMVFTPAPASELNLIGEVSSSEEDEDKMDAVGETVQAETPEPVEKVIEESVDLIQEKETHTPSPPARVVENTRQIELEGEVTRANQELQSLRGKLAKQKDRIANTGNPFLKERFTRELNELEEEEARMLQELETIRTQLSDVS